MQIPSYWLLGPHRRRRRILGRLEIEVERAKAKPWSIIVENGALEGLIWSAGADRPYLLHLYGAGMSVDMEIGRCAWLSQHYGLNVACMDYRAYGRTGGPWVPEALIADAIAAHDHLRLLAGSNPIHVQGFSMGAAMAAHVAAARPVDSVILLAPPASFDDCRADAFDRIPLLGWIHRRWPFQFEPIMDRLLNCRRPIMDLETPLMILHGDRDRTIHIRQGEMVYWASASPMKRLIPMQGATHCSLPWKDGEYAEALDQWFFDLGMPIPLANRSQTGKIPSCSKGILEVNAKNPLHS